MAAGSIAVTVLFSLFVGPRLENAWRPRELEVRHRASPARFDELEELALRYVGRPYVSGGVGNPGFDCSGFTCRVFAEGGYAIPRVSRDQARAGRFVPLDRLAPGDLVFFADRPRKTHINHVGIYLGRGEIVHASTGEGEVVVASLGTAWFQKHLVSARRLLPEPGRSATPTGSAPPAPTLELVEHTGEDALPPMLSRPPRRPRLDFGPTPPGQARTAVGVRSAALTELGVWGLVLAPEASLSVRSIALDVALALPVRFSFDDRPTIGEFERVADFGRILRTASLGLRGADLELRLSQYGDLDLLSGLVLDKVAPASRATGVPGFSIGRAPLAFYGRVRAEVGALEALADDVFDPSLLGVGLSVPFLGALRASAGFATDQRAELEAGRRAINALEAGIAFEALETRQWTLELSLSGAGLRGLARTGGLVLLTGFAEHRFTEAASASFAARIGGVGRNAVDALFSATYPGAEVIALSALGEASTRAVTGAELHVALGRFVLGVLFEDALGPHALPLDRRAEALAELRGLSLGGTHLLDLRAAYASRGLFRPGPTEQVLHATAALRLSTWLRLEAYLEHGPYPRSAVARDADLCSGDFGCARTEGGAGVAVVFEP